MKPDILPPRPKIQLPEQQNTQPGHQSQMEQKPVTTSDMYEGAGKLNGKVALITGGDSGIGRAIAVAFAKEGADIAVNYLKEHEDAQKTRQAVEEQGQRCLGIAGDIGNEDFCKTLVEQVIDELGQLDILVNNAGEQHPQKSLLDISSEQLERTFRTNIFGMFYLTKAALPYLKEGSSIINTTSVTAYKGSPGLLDYSSTKGAIVSFTRSLALSLVEQGIRVNAVAPGPIWTPLIPSTFDEQKVEQFGQDVPLKRAGQPDEVAHSYVFLASGDSSYMTGQVLHPNGGTIVNG